MPKVTPAKDKFVLIPALYRFTIPEQPKESKWGWHNVAELVQAIKDNLIIKGEKPLTISAIEKRFHHHSPLEYKKFLNTTYPASYMIIRNGILMPTRLKRWLQGNIGGDVYLPAKVGLAILKEINQPPSQLQRLLTKVLPNISPKEG